MRMEREEDVPLGWGLPKGGEEKKREFGRGRKGFK
jgi:hypothetical protein